MLKDEFHNLLCTLHHRYPWFLLDTPRHSITNTEMFLIFCKVQEIKPTILFESGVGQGRSTVMLAEMMRPFGRVVAADFRYSDDGNMPIFPFSEDYDNLTLVHDHGENVVTTLPEGRLAAVIDGPKPSGERWGRPGWDLLMERLMYRRPEIVFQHDVSGIEPGSAYDRVCRSLSGPDYRVSLITRQFMRENQFFRNWQAAKKKGIPNLGILEKINEQATPHGDRPDAVRNQPAQNT